MEENQLLDTSFLANEFNTVFGDDPKKTMSPEYFLANYRSLLKRYISNGNPSADTKNSYESAIDQFLSWCFALNTDVFKMNEQKLLYYRSVLVNKNYKPASVKFKLSAIRRFYYVAQKYNLIQENPAINVRAQRDPDAYLPVLKYLTLDQLQKLLDTFDEEDEESLRTKVIVYLMAIEGLRTVEVHRMNVQDIYTDMKAIYIRGKGHNDMIYLRDDTMALLTKYLERRVNAHDFPTPVFTSLSNNSRGHRISRQNIRESINKALKQLDYKGPGKSCHMLRHTCGTLLYNETKDLQVVKQVLRHRGIEMTSRYSHIQDAMLSRYTKAIPIKPSE